MSETRPIWTRASAIRFLRGISLPLALNGFSPALAGSVLYRGYSRNDLDIVLIPLGMRDSGYKRARYALEKAGLRCILSRRAVRRLWRSVGSTDKKHVEIWQDKRGRRVDVFFLQ